MSQLLTPERIGSHRISRGNFGFPNQAGPDSPIENIPLEHPQAVPLSPWHQSVPQSSSLGMPATIYTPNATTSTFSESGQPGSMIDDNYQGRHSTTGSFSSFAFVDPYPTFYNEFTPQSPVPIGQSDISTRGSGGNYNRMSADHANRSTQENEIEGDFDEVGSEDESDQRGLADRQNPALYGNMMQFPSGYSAPILEHPDMLMASAAMLSSFFGFNSSSEPWNPLEVPIHQNTNPDQIMFAPDLRHDLQSSRSLRNYPSTGNVQDEVDSKTRTLRPQDCLQSLQASLEKSFDNSASASPAGPSDLAVADPTHKSKKALNAKSKGRRHRGLSPQRRKQVDSMRKRKACWHCKIMRESCDEDNICKRCKVMRPQSFPWGCVRYRLAELTPFFLPGSLLDQHQEEKIREFARKHVRSWTNNCMTVNVTWGHSRDILCEVQEIIPEGDYLCFQNQYKLNLATNNYDRVLTPSPPLGIVLTLLEDCSQRLERPLGMMLMTVNDWRKKLDQYLDYVLENDFHDFPEHCFRGSENEVQRDLLCHFHKYYESTAGTKGQALPNVFLKLVIISKIMMHTLTLVEREKEVVARRLLYRSSEPYGTHTSSRWLNKQLKFLLSTLHEELLKNTLRKINSLLESSQRPKTWGSALTGLILLTMTIEAIQMIIRCKEATDKSENLIPEESLKATIEIENCEKNWSFLQGLFYTTYHKNPIHNEKDRQNLKDAPSQQLASDVKSVIEKHRCFLESRQHLGPPPNSSNPHTSRLVARFLLYSENSTASV